MHWGHGRRFIYRKTIIRKIKCHERVGDGNFALVLNSKLDGESNGIFRIEKCSVLGKLGTGICTVN